MRVLFATTANIGHFGPMVPFAHACARAGHEVRVCAPESFVDTVRGTGLTFVPLGEPTPGERGPLLARLPSLPRREANQVVIRDLFAGVDARAALPAMERAVDGFRPDLVVRELAEFASYAVAQRRGVRQLEIAIGPAETGRAVAAMLDDALAALGCDDSGLLDTPLATVVPERLDPASTRPTRRFRYQPPPAADRGVPAVPGDGPLVYASFGTVAAALPSFAGAYRELVAAVAGRRVRALLTVGHAGDALDTVLAAPPHVRIERFWPQQDVMPHAAAAIGHGGFGTTMTALAHGVPLVVVPLFASDQFLNAEAVARVGAGVAVDSPADIGEALDTVLADDSYRLAAQRLAADMAALPLPDASVFEH
ncbi:glycosyltransferase [Actinosynnema sp. NPDC047251]|uniref:Glycosyltransferase, family 1 n=1 Tax=Saccharothrix espanaensis (strain ATCC 51144 / DSM 44229 / JCM 9112 / NBRC 15066 / NRRL 15764) TaxID=1179773 RepID=K0K4R9_SACES|nr:glycosyltransferase [Saccharothrix espanaensis]CCH33291.1 Glycosyltransferase, family 1 [Saccharothrix espanaensis DSM 44229]